MAAPSFFGASDGYADAGGAWAWTTTGCPTTTPIGTLAVFQILQDGTTDSAITLSVTNAYLENLAGTDNALTQIVGPNGDGSWPIGSAATGRQFLWIGRTLRTAMNLTSGNYLSGTNSTSEDLYMRLYFFSSASTGTTLATVIENSTTGNATNGAGTSTTVSDTAVTTLGPDRLALNFVGLSDDAMGLDAFAGETGGDWTLPVAIYEESSGTDATIGLMNAAMANAGTIDGGSDSITSVGWGVVGFALIGTTVVLDQQHFRFRNDDGDETTATWKADLDTAVN